MKARIVGVNEVVFSIFRGGFGGLTGGFGGLTGGLGGADDLGVNVTTQEPELSV